MKNNSLPMELLDIKSIAMCLATYLGFLIPTQSDILFFVTAGVGITTISYNVLRIVKTLKRK